MMIIDLNSMVHIPSLSYYNHNYYSIKDNNSGSMLLVKSRDDNHEHDIYVCDGSGEIFLGSAEESKGDDTVLRVELLRAYT